MVPPHWNHILAEWLAGLRDEMRVAEGTLTKYAQAARDYAIGVGVGPSEVALDDARRYVRSRSDLGPSTLRVHLCAIKSLHRFLGHSWTDKLRGPRRPERLPRAMSVREALEILETCRPVDWVSTRDRAMLEVLYSSGCRAAELLGLNLSDLRLPEGRMHVIGKGNRERVCLLGPESVLAVAQWLTVRDTPGEVLFVSLQYRTRMTPMGLWKMVKARSLAAGVQGHVHPHMFRHACASHMLRNGADLRSIQLTLGHKSLATTQHYLAMDDEAVRSVHARAHPRGRASDLKLRTIGGRDDMDVEDTPS